MSDPTQIRGSTQIQDWTVTYNKLDNIVRDLINGSWTRVTVEALDGQTLINIPGLKGLDKTEVRRNGILLHTSEYSITDNFVELDDPLSADELVTVFYGAKLSSGEQKPLDAGSAS